VLEGIRPKFGVKASTREHQVKGVTNGLMRPFHRTILVGGIGTCGTDVIAITFEEAANLGILVQFASLVKVDVFVVTRRGMSV
jgi:hypothetical protein